MTKEPTATWRDALRLLEESITAEHFRENLDWFIENYGDAPEAVGTAYFFLITDWLAQSVGLFAALSLSPDEMLVALTEIRKTLTNLNLEEQKNQLKSDEQPYYEVFVQQAKPLLFQRGQAMEALFDCYVAGNYDPSIDPNELVVEAKDIAEEDIEGACSLITQAGAIALDSGTLWWRWPIEVEDPIAPWLSTVFELVEAYTVGGQMPLGPIEQARQDMKALTEKEQAEWPESKVDESLDPQPSPVDTFIEELIDQGDAPYTPEQLKFCKTHRDTIVPALTDLATDEYLQMADAPGDGYAPIRAVQLLGKLRAEEAITPLIDIVADVDLESIISDAALFALREIGQPAFEYVLTFMRYSSNVQAKIKMAELFNEVDQPDDAAYQALVDVWHEAPWENGKCLLAYPIARTGGEEAIPLLQAALEDPGMDNVLDYGEIAYALEQLGIEAPPSPDDLKPPWDPAEYLHSFVAHIAAPESLMYFVDATEANIESDLSRERFNEVLQYPEELAHLYAIAKLDELSFTIAAQSLIVPPELSIEILPTLLEAVETLSFDEQTSEFPHWLRETYAHVAESAGPELQQQLIGILAALLYYFREDYDITDNPNRLLENAREIQPDEGEMRHLFAQAGALILHGRTVWHRWPAETDYPLSAWLEGLMIFRRPLEGIGQIPLRPSPDVDPQQISAALVETTIEQSQEITDAPPDVRKLLDLLLTHGQEYLPQAQRLPFVHQRAAIVPYLIQLAENDLYWYEGSPGDGWAAVLAVRLLGELKASQGAEVLVTIIADTPSDAIIHESALLSLINIGPPALPAVQDYFRYGRSIETKAFLAEVLGIIGRRDRSTFEFLRQTYQAAQWTQNKRRVALAFGDLQDRRAIPLLEAALQDRRADALDVTYAQWALLQLGIPLSKQNVRPRRPRLRTPPPQTPRLIHDERDMPQRLEHTPWGEPLCPDCGARLVLDENGTWTHPPDQPARSDKSKRRKKRKRRKRYR